MRTLILTLAASTALTFVSSGFTQVIQSRAECPLCEAVWDENEGAFQWLVAAGSDPNAQCLDSDNGETPLICVALWFDCDSEKMLRMTSALLAAGADPSVPDFRARRPLLIAVEKDCPELASLLLNASADPNIIVPSPGFFSTPLHWAVSRGSAELVTLLVESGADPNMRNSIHQTPLDIALERDDPEIAEILRGAGGRAGWR